MTQRETEMSHVGYRSVTAALARPDLPGLTPGSTRHVDEVRSAFTANVRADDQPVPRSW